MECVCGGVHGDFAKRAFPESKADRKKRDAELAAKGDVPPPIRHVPGLPISTGEFAADTFDHRARARPEKDRVAGPMHKLTCPLWAFRPFALSPVDLNIMLGVVDKGPWAKMTAGYEEPDPDTIEDFIYMPHNLPP